MLDQLCDGLRCLGVLKAMRCFPHLILPLFVFTGSVSTEEVLEAVYVKDNISEEEGQVIKHLHHYLGEASVEGIP